MPRRFSILATLALLSAAAVIVPGEARAQCMPDNLDSAPCCTPVSAILPVFPAITQTSKFICFRDCATQLNQNLCVDIGAPKVVNSGGPVCALNTINFKIKTCGGANQVLWQGTLRAHYARNWQEFTPLTTYGVWRILLNGDLKATALLQANPGWASPNVQPGCYSTYQRIYVQGYVDYAFDCTLNTWTASWALDHECDSIHHPAGSPRAGGAFHPNRSWTFVGPGAGFVVDPITTLTASGTSSLESMRWNDWSTLPNICRAEEASNGQLQSLGSFCPCSTNPGAPGQYDNTAVSLVGACGSFTRSIVPPLVPVLQKRIGQWTNGAVFPGVEYLNMVTGDMDYFNFCSGNFTNEFFEGAVTLGGFPAATYPPMIALGRVFMDLGSSNRQPNNLQRRVGVPKVSQYIVNIDLP